MTERTAVEDLLHVYVNDHRAGATGGLALAQRIRDEHAEDNIGEVIGGIVGEIEQDAASLERLAAEHGVSRNLVKHFGAFLGERVSRFKLNGRVWWRSPLSPVVELEALMAGVDAKRNLWRSMQASAAGERSPLDFDELIRRATDQHTRLQGLHADAARTAFGTASSTHRTGEARDDGAGFAVGPTGACL